MQHKLPLLITLLVLVTSKNYCQETENTKVYEIRNSIAVYPCVITGKRIPPDDKFLTPPLKAKFQLVRPLNDTNDEVIIRYLIWKKDSALKKIYNDRIIRTGWDTIKSRDRSARWRNNDTGKISAADKYEDSVDQYFLKQL